MTIPELLQTLAGKVVNHVTCTFEQYQGITDKDSNTLYYATDRKAIFKGAIKLCDLTEIGDLRNLETSNYTNLVAAINEVNQKATNNQGSGVINDSTISPFAGFMPNNVGGIIEGSYAGTDEGVVMCNYERTRFYYRIPTDTGYRFYTNWFTSYLYNTTSDSYASAKTGKIFSYNDKHYIVINGELQDIAVLLSETQVTTLIDEAKTQAKTYTDGIATQTLSNSKFYTDEQINNIPQGNQNQFGLVKLSDSITGSNYGDNNGVAATPKAVASVTTAAKNYTDTTASQTLKSANQYTDNKINAKIQLVPALPDEPTSGVLYLIVES